MFASSGIASLSAFRLVVAPSAAAGQAYLQQLEQQEPDVRGVTVTLRGLRDTLVCAPGGQNGPQRWRALGAWEERRLWLVARDAARRQVQAKLALAVSPELDLPALQWLRRMGVAPSTLFAGAPLLEMTARTLEHAEAIRCHHGLLDEAAQLHAALARLRDRKQPLPAAWRQIRQVRVLCSCDIHGEMVLWLEALAERFDSLVIERPHDTKHEQRTPYARAQLGLVENTQLAAECIEPIDFVPPKQRVQPRLVRVAWGEEALQYTAQTLARWHAEGIAYGEQAVIFSRALVRGDKGRAGLQLVERLHDALGRRGIAARLMLERGMQQPAWAQRLLLGLDVAQALAEQRPVRPLQLAELVTSLCDVNTAPGSAIRSQQNGLAQALRRLAVRNWLPEEIVAVWRQYGDAYAPWVARLQDWLECWMQPLVRAQTLLQAMQVLRGWTEALTQERDERLMLDEQLAELHIAECQARSWGAGALGRRQITEALRGALEGLPMPQHDALGAVTVGVAEALVGRAYTASVWWGANPSLMRSAVPGLPPMGKKMTEALQPIVGAAMGRELKSSPEARARFLLGRLQTQTTGPSCIVFLARGDVQDAGPSAALQADLEQYVAKPAVPQDVASACEDPGDETQVRRFLGHAGRHADDDAWRTVAEAPWAAALARRVLATRALHRKLGGLGGHGAAQLQHRMLSYVHSATQLDDLAKCRFRYFAAHVLSLRAYEDVTPELSSARRGSVMHRALYVTYTTLLTERPYRAWRVEPKAARARGASIVREQWESIVGRERIGELFVGSLRDEVSRAVDAQLFCDFVTSWQLDMEPVAFELGFGREGDEASALQLSHPQDPKKVLRVRGSIDRVDRGGDVQRIIDYKSSMPQNIEDGRHLQLPIYQLAAAKQLGSMPRWEAAWATLGAMVGSVKVKAPEKLRGLAEDMQAKTQKTLWARVDPLLSGDIAPDAEKDVVCHVCDFAALCRFVPGR